MSEQSFGKTFRITTPREEGSVTIRSQTSPQRERRDNQSPVRERRTSSPPSRRETFSSSPTRRETLVSRRTSPEPVIIRSGNTSTPPRKPFTEKQRETDIEEKKVFKPSSLEQISLLRRGISPSVRERRQSPLTEDEPQFIEGPVNFIYLVGDPGDGVERKLLLLGDYHQPKIKCEPEINKTISVADFCRYIANRMVPKIIDIFIESPFKVRDGDSQNPSKEGEGHYLINLRHTFRDCLNYDKSQCTELMRIHYIDPRLSVTTEFEPLSQKLLVIFVFQLMDPKFYLSKRSVKSLDKIKWPEEKDIKHTTELVLKEARLTDDKLNSLHPSIRKKFKVFIIRPFLSALSIFYRSKNIRNLFYESKQIAARIIETKTPITPEEHRIVTQLELALFKIQIYILDVYFIYRLLKRATQYRPDQRGIALKVGEPITHIIGYTGAGHTIRIRDMLLNMGFMVINQEDRGGAEILAKVKQYDGPINQCLPYNLIRDSVNNFCLEK
jgi:hypothetical protein